MKRDLLDIYRTGAEFLERHPTIQAIHTLFGRVIENMPTRRRRNRSGVGRAPGATDDDIRRGVAFLYCGSALFVIIALIFGFFPFGLMALFLYAFGIAVSKSLKYPYVAQTDSVMVKQPEKQKEPATPKPMIHRFFVGIDIACLAGWVYLCLNQPETVKAWIGKWDLLNTLFLSKQDLTKLDNVTLAIAGAFVLSFVLGIIKAILRLFLLIFKNLSPKRDVREL